MAFLKRIGMFCTQNINWNCVIYQAQLRGFSTFFQPIRKNPIGIPIEIL